MLTNGKGGSQRKSYAALPNRLPFVVIQALLIMDMLCLQVNQGYHDIDEINYLDNPLHAIDLRIYLFAV